MSEKYIPLYRKYRPKNLQEVVGQEHIKKALANAIELNKISHAYLFTGPRGTGKTSTARILAKSLNCKEGPTLTPCEECPSCLDIKNSNPIDVIEIDAASNRSVEDAQNILEKIQYVPVNGRYKIYIIDEIHMLSNHAFNALLKTLEEPPENVIFILATTEPHKVLETITSRCQRFDFRRITTSDIIGHLKNISKLEKIKIDDDAISTIAKSASGGMRDSLALLDQVSVLDSAKTITTEDVNKLLGRLSFEVLNAFSEFIIDSKAQDAIEYLNKIYNSGNEPTQILTNLLGYFKNLLIVKNCQGEDLLAELTQLAPAQIAILKKQDEKVDTHQIVFLIEKVSNYLKELKTTTNQQLWLEVAIIDLANLAQNTSLLELQDRVSRLESGTPLREQGTRNREQPLQSVKSKVQSDKSKEEDKKSYPSLAEGSKSVISGEGDNSSTVQSYNPPSGELVEMPASKPKQKDDLSVQWINLLQSISSAPTVSLLNQHSRPVEISENGIVIGCEKEFSLKMLSSESKKKTIQEAAKKLYGKDVSVQIKLISAEAFAQGQKKNLIENSQSEIRNVKSDQNKVIGNVNEVGQALPDKMIEGSRLGLPAQQPEANDELDEEDEFVEQELVKKSKKAQSINASDQVSMVINLFDGKYIE